ncbi:MAG: type II secretion system protein [Sedimentisphaerales bacterium]
MAAYSKKKGFTLVELLVAISIIAALLSIIMPSLNKARQQAKSIFCLNNLNQMSIAAINYTHSFNDYYPLAYYDKKVGAVKYSYAWDFAAYKDWSAMPVIVVVKPGILWQKITIDRVQQCPSYKEASNDISRPYTGYNYNTSYIGMDETILPYNSIRAARIKRPSETAVFGDGQYSGGANNFMRAPFSTLQNASFSANYAGTQGYRHLGKTNVAFCDGHSVSWKDLYTNTASNGKKILDTYNSTHKEKIGFLSPDNSAYDLE